MLKRIAALRAKKDIVSAKIQQEASRPQPDTVRLRLLKQQRLRLKDQIAHASRASVASVGPERGTNQHQRADAPRRAIWPPAA